MRYFEIVDQHRRRRTKPCGLLSFDEETRDFRILINPEMGTEEVPMLFIPFMEKGQYELLPDVALIWVQERIPPPNRQNIAEILIANGLEEYDELVLLLAGEGRCCQDEFMVREVRRVEGRTAGAYEYAEIEPRRSVELKRSLGRQIVAMREHKHMSQLELAERSGIPRTMISRIEHGTANPTLETVAALAKGLVCEIDLLLK